MMPDGRRLIEAGLGMAQTRAPSIRADFKAACSVVSPRTISHSGERLPPIQPAYCTALSILAAGFYDLPATTGER
jgi:hypothetical protein